MRGMVRLLAATVAWMVACAAVVAPVLPSRAADGAATIAEPEPSKSVVAYEPVDRLQPPARFRASGYPSRGDLELDALRASPFAGTGQERPTLTDALTELQGEPPSLNADLSIPAPVLAAYENAELRSGELADGCFVPWQVLAGIGKVESGHGTIGAAATMDADGTFAEPILGPQLSGGPGTASIPDSDGGVLDGDTEWDRAVGPMQFIPTSWQQFGLDGNDDGIVDPNNVHDAAMSAAAHLCRTVPGDYRVDAASLAQAIYSYNRSTAYVATVLRWINAYRGIDAPPRELPTYSPPTYSPPTYSPPTWTPPSVPTYTPPAPPPRRQVAQAPTQQPPPSSKPTASPTPGGAAARPAPSPAPTTDPAANPEPTPTPTHPWPACFWLDRECTDNDQAPRDPDPIPPAPTPPATDPPTAPQPTDWPPAPVDVRVVQGSDTGWPVTVRTAAVADLVSRLAQLADAADTDSLTALLADVSDAGSVATALVDDAVAGGEVAPASVDLSYPADTSQAVRVAVTAYRRSADGAAANPQPSPWILAKIGDDGHIVALVLGKNPPDAWEEEDEDRTPSPTPTDTEPPQPTVTPAPPSTGSEPPEATEAAPASDPVHEPPPAPSEVGDDMTVLTPEETPRPEPSGTAPQEPPPATATPTEAPSDPETAQPPAIDDVLARMVEDEGIKLMESAEAVELLADALAAASPEQRRDVWMLLDDPERPSDDELLAVLLDLLGVAANVRAAIVG